MTRRFAVVHEAPPDFDTATHLADRELVEAVEWLDEDQLPHMREWVGEVPAGRFTWKSIGRLANAAGIRAQGRFNNDEPGVEDARTARRAILYLRHLFPDLAAVVLLRDQDNRPDRRRGLEQARDHDDGRIPIVIGLAVVERECWVLSGFEPDGPDETTRHAALHQELGYDPRDRSHDLTACKDDNALRSPKRALRHLSQNDRERESRCWRQTPLPLLRQRGAQNGLAAYLAEVRTRLAPLIGG